MSSPISTLSNLSEQSSTYLNPTTELRSTGSKNLGIDDFLKLITVQLSNQDPLKPMEDTQFISQMASFTSLEQMQTLAKDFSSFTTQQKQTSAQDYLGKAVSLDDGAATVSGVVTKVTFKDGSALLSINGKDYDASGVTSISNPGTAATTVPPTQTNPSSTN